MADAPSAPASSASSAPDGLPAMKCHTLRGQPWSPPPGRAVAARRAVRDAPAAHGPPVAAVARHPRAARRGRTRVLALGHAPGSAVFGPRVIAIRDEPKHVSVVMVWARRTFCQVDRSARLSDPATHYVPTFSAPKRGPSVKR